MREYILFLTMLFCAVFVKAADVEATITPTVIGMENGAITLTINAGIAPYTFSWVGPDGYTSNDQNISDLAAGEYCVTVSDAFCGVAVLCVTVDATGANTISLVNTPQIQLVVGPNPFNGFINMQITTMNPGEYSFTIYDLEGKLIARLNEALSLGPNCVNWQLEQAFPSGSYQLVVAGKSGDFITSTLLHF